MADNFHLLEGEQILAELGNLVLTNKRVVGYSPSGELRMLSVRNVDAAGLITASADWLVGAAVVCLIASVLVFAVGMSNTTAGGGADVSAGGAFVLLLLAIAAIVGWAMSKSTRVAVTAGTQQVATLLQGHEQPAAVAFCRTVLQTTATA